jgi:hypothetical protein
LFRPEELELLICGSPELDFTALEKVCKVRDLSVSLSRCLSVSLSVSVSPYHLSLSRSHC